MPTLTKTTQNKQPMFTGDMVRTYLREIGRVPLLTNEQEIQLSKQIQSMMALLSQKEELEAALEREPTQLEWANHVQLTEAQLAQIIRLGVRAKSRMIEANLRLVVAIAKKYQKRNMEFLDLIQEGSIGLEKAVEKFDHTKGYKFSTYAYWWIRQGITRAIATQGRAIRLPIHITEKLNKIKKVQRDLIQTLGRTPKISEIAEVLGLTNAEIRNYLNIAKNPVSLDLKVGDNQDTELQELLEDDGISPDTYTTQLSLREDLEKIISELTPQEQEVITLRFGFKDGNELSLAKVGDALNLSR
ncbi:MAG TPA: RNA polymerase sigma factor, RpoD/SigA family, partial [Allocoleopsis sp.]